MCDGKQALGQRGDITDQKEAVFDLAARDVTYISSSHIIMLAAMIVHPQTRANL